MKTLCKLLIICAILASICFVCYTIYGIITLDLTLSQAIMPILAVVVLCITMNLLSITSYKSMFEDDEKE